MSLLVSIIFQVAGLFCLSLSMKKHFKAFYRRPPSQKLSSGYFKYLGFIFLGLSLIFLVVFDRHVSMALVWWLGYVSFNIFGLALLYCWREA